MGLLRIAAAGALGYFAYQAWQRRASTDAIDHDTSARADSPLVTDVSDDSSTAPRRDSAATLQSGQAH